jgi:hypothetical protein
MSTFIIDGRLHREVEVSDDDDDDDAIHSKLHAQELSKKLDDLSMYPRDLSKDSEVNAGLEFHQNQKEPERSHPKPQYQHQQIYWQQREVAQMQNHYQQQYQIQKPLLSQETTAGTSPSISSTAPAVHGRMRSYGLSSTGSASGASIRSGDDDDGDEGDDEDEVGENWSPSTSSRPSPLAMHAHASKTKGANKNVVNPLMTAVIANQYAPKALQPELHSLSRQGS